MSAPMTNAPSETGAGHTNGPSYGWTEQRYEVPGFGEKLVRVSTFESALRRIDRLLFALETIAQISGSDAAERMREVALAALSKVQP